MSRSSIGIIIAVAVVLSVAMAALLYDPQKPAVVRASPPAPPERAASGGTSENNGHRMAATPAPEDSDAASEDARPQPSRAPFSGLAAQIHDCLVAHGPNWRAEFDRLLALMRPGDAPAILEAIRDLRRQGSDLPLRDLSDSLWSHWGEVDPNGALKFLESQPNRFRNENAYEVLQSWAAKDRVAAQNWLSAHTDSPYYNSAVMGFINKFSALDPRGATQFATTNLRPGSRQLTEALNQISDQIYRQGRLQGLQQWFAQLPADPKLRQSIVNNVASTLLPRDVQSAANWLVAAANGGFKNDEAISDVASRYASFSPEAAINFVSSLPADSRGYYLGTNRVVRQWMAQSPQGVQDWLSSNQGSPAYQSVVYEYARALARTDPNAAAPWIGRITNPDLRAAAMQGSRR